jgi:hypothetical protein
MAPLFFFHCGRGIAGRTRYCSSVTVCAGAEVSWNPMSWGCLSRITPLPAGLSPERQLFSECLAEFWAG